MSMKNKIIYILFVIIIFVSGCSRKNPETRSLDTDKPLTVVATTGMLADAVSNVGGDYINVIALMGPGVDPHLYKASEGDVTKLDKANVVVYNGLHLEGKMGEIFNKMKRTRPVITAGELIPDHLLKSPPQFAGQYDPHIWFDLSLWKTMVLELAEEMGNIDTLCFHRRIHDRSRWILFSDGVVALAQAGYHSPLVDKTGTKNANCCGGLGFAQVSTCGDTKSRTRRSCGFIVK